VYFQTIVTIHYLFPSEIFPMIEDGEYAAWYKTPRGEGTGIVVLANGKITGSDAVLAYSGSYKVDGDHLSALVFTERHSPGQASLFGIDDIELELDGKLSGNTVACSGHARHAPEVPFQVTLIRVQGQRSFWIGAKRRPADPTISPRQPITPRPIIRPV
jgi:T3SS negative regulator,GrlR